MSFEGNEFSGFFSFNKRNDSGFLAHGMAICSRPTRARLFCCRSTSVGQSGNRNAVMVQQSVYLLIEQERLQLTVHYRIPPRFSIETSADPELT